MATTAELAQSKTWEIDLKTRSKRVQTTEARREAHELWLITLISACGHFQGKNSKH